MSAPPLVVKFGGTSLGSPRRLRRAAARLAAHRRAGRRVVAVVSATGHTTDRLLRRVGAAVAGEWGEAQAREVDRALATGEDLAAALLASALTALGVPARSLRGGEAGVEAVGDFGAGRVRRVDPAPLLRLLDQGVVPVASGFQGLRDDGETLTLGRGGSDTSAVAIAAALRAECHVVTDVDAVYDRDPRAGAGAVPFARISHRELLELALGGAQVVHEDAVRLALGEQVPLRVYHHAAPLGGRGGTRVELDAERSVGPAYRPVTFPLPPLPPVPAPAGTVTGEAA